MKGHLVPAGVLLCFFESTNERFVDFVLGEQRDHFSAGWNPFNLQLWLSRFRAKKYKNCRIERPL